MSARRALFLGACALALSACHAKDVELLDDPGAGAAGGSSSGGVETQVIVPGTPDNAPALFDVDPAHDEGGKDAPRILYPNDETMFPRNLERVRYQWSAGDKLDLFEVRFDSDAAHVRYYTSDRFLLPDADGFRMLAAANAGGSLQMTVRGLARKMPDKVYGGKSIALYFSESEVLGALYYWSTGAQGVMRAQLSAPTATKFYTDPAAPNAGTCAACHSLSRDGRKLAVGYGGEFLRVINVADRSVLIPAGATDAPTVMMPETEPMMMPKPPKDPMMDPMTAPIPGAGPEYGWGSFNPDGTRLIYATKGALKLIDASSGAALGDVKLPDGYRANYPDWSPDGRFVAIAYFTSDMDGNDKEISGSSLARLAVNDDDTFGAPEILLASGGKDDTLYFPAYSPDSRWLAFVRAKGKSKDSPNAQLFLLAADGSGEPIALDRLNHGASSKDMPPDMPKDMMPKDMMMMPMMGGDVGDSMPTWAPSSRPGIFWLAFSSTRDYGDVLVDAKRDQLWAAAIDPARIDKAMDPSYAAFWMPFQDPNEGNHRAFWALASEDNCSNSIEICDQLDNDCNGLVDDDCCTPSPELCGDGKDNDCDGLKDEHCDCADVETCDNGQDDDCDSEVDEDCLI